MTKSSMVKRWCMCSLITISYYYCYSSEMLTRYTKQPNIHEHAQTHTRYRVKWLEIFIVLQAIKNRLRSIGHFPFYHDIRFQFKCLLFLFNQMELKITATVHTHIQPSTAARLSFLLLQSNIICLRHLFCNWTWFEHIWSFPFPKHFFISNLHKLSKKKTGEPQRH